MKRTFTVRTRRNLDILGSGQLPTDCNASIRLEYRKFTRLATPEVFSTFGDVKATFDETVDIFLRGNVNGQTHPLGVI